MIRFVYYISTQHLHLLLLTNYFQGSTDIKSDVLKPFGQGIISVYRAFPFQVAGLALFSGGGWLVGKAVGWATSKKEE